MVEEYFARFAFWLAVLLALVLFVVIPLIFLGRFGRPLSDEVKNQGLFDGLGGISGAEQHLRRAPDAKPGLLADRRVRGQPAAYRREPRNQCVHARRLGDRNAARSAGKLFAQPVIEPAPRHTTMSPGRAISRIIEASWFGSASGRTLR